MSLFCEIPTGEIDPTPTLPMLGRELMLAEVKMLNIDGLDETDRWLDLRDRMGRLWARYDPRAEVLEMRRGEVSVRFALQAYRAQVIREVGGRQEGTDVLE